MITKLKISNFKSHQNTELNTGALTLLSGVNSSGKSSVLQALLLLRQSYKKGRLSAGLDLNAPLCDIGKGIDALNQFSENEIINFSFDIDKTKNYDFNFNVNNRYEDTLIPNKVPLILESTLLNLPLFTNNFQYLSAGRIAGVDLYPMDSYAVETEKQLSVNYGQGELVAHFLEYYGNHRDFNIESTLLLHKSTTSKKLLDQTIAWENEISPRLTMTTKKEADKVTIDYGYKGVGSHAPTKDLKPKNIGFGISYSLSIVVALLSAQPGALLIIENPEAHLHPRGQSKLAELIARTAKSGVQIFIESHSDHIFNGIRKAIHAGLIDNSIAKIHFFELDEQNTSRNTEIKFSDRGRIINTQSGLFDQFDDDLDELLDL
jgi:predicted ATPase